MPFGCAVAGDGALIDDAAKRSAIARMNTLLGAGSTLTSPALPSPMVAIAGRWQRCIGCLNPPDHERPDLKATTGPPYVPRK